MELEPENWALLADLGQAEGEQWQFLPFDEAMGSPAGIALISESNTLILHDPEEWDEAIKETPSLWQHRCLCGKVFPTRRALLGHISGMKARLSESARRRMQKRHGVMA